MNYTLENFIQYCDNMQITEEGFFKDLKDTTKGLVKGISSSAKYNKEVMYLDDFEEI